MSKLTKVKRGTVRRFLLDVIKPTPTLGKRGREDEPDNSSRTQRPQPATSATVTQATSAPPACIALQNEDADEDAVVITALNAVPFCCHADLVTMNRAELLTVANTLNKKLPLAMQMDTSSSCSDLFIRSSIEVLVGIRNSMPSAPKRLRSRSVHESPRIVPPSPASPLAGRCRSTASLCVSPMAMLREEDEDSRGSSSSSRPPKRRRMTAPPPTSTLDSRRPITRAQAYRVAPVVNAPNAAESPTVITRVVRARSQKPAQRPPLYPSIHANVTVTRGRSMNRGKTAHGEKRTSFAMTSTPRKRATAAVNSPESGTPRFRPFLADVLGTAPSNKRASTSKAEENADSQDITFGLDGLTMPIASQDSSDMDISM